MKERTITLAKYEILKALQIYGMTTLYDKFYNNHHSIKSLMKKGLISCVADAGYYSIFKLTDGANTLNLAELKILSNGRRTNI